MKTCPYCAESIQDAAIVCKHCHRDLKVTAPVAPIQTPPKPVRWGRLILILLAIVAVPVIAVQCGSRAKYLDFDQRRTAWLERCERYKDTPLTNPVAKACNDELLTLTAEAKREGWMK